DNGRVLKTIDGARLPAWAPDGSKLAFLGGARDDSLQQLDTNFGAPTNLAQVGQAIQPPVWSRDSKLLYVVGRTVEVRGNDPPESKSYLIRVAVGGGRPTKVSLDSEPTEGEGRPVSFTYDPA